MKRRELYPSDHPTPGIFVAQWLHMYPDAIEQGLAAAQAIKGPLDKQPISNPDLVGRFNEYTALTNPADMELSDRREVVWRGVYVAYQTLRRVPKTGLAYLMEDPTTTYADNDDRCFALTAQGIAMASACVDYLEVCDMYQPYVDPDNQYPAGLLRGVLGGFAMLENGERNIQRTIEYAERQAEYERLERMWAA